MQLVIRIENGQPVDHPIAFENFALVHPGADYENLPAGYMKFIRVPRPDGPFVHVAMGPPTYVVDGDVVRDQWEVTPYTQEERQQKIQQALLDKPFPSWIVNEDDLSCAPPTPYPTDGKIYEWNEQTLSWQEWTPPENP